MHSKNINGLNMFILNSLSIRGTICSFLMLLNPLICWRTGSAWVFSVSPQVLWETTAEFDGVWRWDGGPGEGKSVDPIRAWDHHALPTTAKQAVSVCCSTYWNGDSWWVAVVCQSPWIQDPAKSTQQRCLKSLWQETQHWWQLLTSDQFARPNLTIKHTYTNAKWKHTHIKKESKTKQWFIFRGYTGTHSFSTGKRHAPVRMSNSMFITSYLMSFTRSRENRPVGRVKVTQLESSRP